MKRISLSLVFFLFLVLIAAAQEISRQEADSMLLKLNKTKTAADRMELLLNLAQFHIFKPGENKIDLDSAEVYLKGAKLLSESAHFTNADGYLLLTESSLIKERGEKVESTIFTSEEGKKMAEKATRILESGTNKDYLGRAYYELSSYYDFNDSLEAVKRIELLQQSAKAFQQAVDLKGEGVSLVKLAELYYLWSDEEKSIQTLKEALAIFNSISYQKLQGIYLLLGRFNYHKHEYAPALSNLLKALKTAQETKDSSVGLWMIYSYIGAIYFDIDRSDIAVKYFNNSLEIARKYDDKDAMFFLSINLSFAYNNLGQWDRSLKVLGDIPKNSRLFKDPAQKTAVNLCYLRAYLGVKRLDKASTHCDTIVNMTDNKWANRVFKRKSMIYMYAANFYFFSNQYAKARYYAAKSHTIAKQTNDDYIQVGDLELLYKIDSAEGNFKAAYNHLLQHKEKIDSFSGERKARQFQVMNVEYEVQMKEDSIKLKDRDIVLLTQKNSLQQENLRQAGLIRNITMTGITLALIIIGLLYHQYMRKQKNNQVITQKNEQLQHLNEQQTKLLTEKDWLVKEIHHRVKNNLQMVVSLLNAQTEFLTHPSAIEAIKESRERMQAIAIIHQKLYQLDNSTRINMRSYINELIDNIKNSFADSKRVHFKVDVADVGLDISQSVPLGLILNEAITNAIKYAYPKNEKGSIQVSLKRYDTDKLQLKIADNGKGLPADVDIKHSNSLGMQLIRLFSEQLDGDLCFVNNNGLEITLNFRRIEDESFESRKITA